MTKLRIATGIFGVGIILSVSLITPAPEQQPPIPPSETPISTLQEKDVILTIEEVGFAIAKVESNGNPKAHNKKEDAVGILQIRRIMVDDVNRICRAPVFRYKDRWDIEASFEMFRIYINHYAKLHTAEEYSRLWNGGPRGMTKESTIAYWYRVRRVLESTRIVSNDVSNDFLGKTYPIQKQP